MIKRILSFFLCLMSCLNAAEDSNRIGQDDYKFFTISNAQFSTDQNPNNKIEIFRAVEVLKEILLEKNCIDEAIESMLNHEMFEARQLITPQESLFACYEYETRFDGRQEKIFKIYRLVPGALEQTENYPTEEEFLVLLIKSQDIVEKVELLKKFTIVKNLEEPIFQQEAFHREMEPYYDMGRSLFVDLKEKTAANGTEIVEFTLYRAIKNNPINQNPDSQEQEQD